jgi:hypothetical protein
MFDEIQFAREFFEELTAIDEAILARAGSEACRFCGGPLHRGDYARKPRGALIGAAAEAFAWRFSLCCGREGCRCRATPPSVRFLGRRVYVGAVVLVASVVALVHAIASSATRATGVPARTTRRWVQWWRGPFVETPVFFEISGRLVPAVERRSLPTSILDRLTGPAPARVRSLLAWLAPLTTASSPDGSRWVRVAM